MSARHECRYWQPAGAKGHRGHRWCNYCGAEQVTVNRGEGLKWERVMTIGQFGHKWGTPGTTTPESCFTIEVGYPFEFNSYESFDVVYRVTFGDLSPAPLRGWQSKWHQYLNRIDAEIAQHRATIDAMNDTESR